MRERSGQAVRHPIAGAALRSGHPLLAVIQPAAIILRPEHILQDIQRQQLGIPPRVARPISRKHLDVAIDHLATAGKSI